MSDPNDYHLYHLCYIGKHHDAWFTTASLADQWGDDWNDAPYEHNAEEPYPWADYRGVPEYDLIKVHYESVMETPAERSSRNSTYSVADINAGGVAWLFAHDHGAIQAGTALPDFIAKIRATDGEVYLALSDVVRLGLVGCE